MTLEDQNRVSRSCCRSPLALCSCQGEDRLSGPLAGGSSHAPLVGIDRCPL